MRRIALRPVAGLGLALTLALGGGACASATRTTTTTPTTHRRTVTTTSARPAAASTTSTTSSTSTLPGAGKPAVTIGDKNYSEQFVLGQLYLQALKAQGFTVNLNQNIGPTDVTLQALKTGALTMYP